jgi:hypothetical protein
MTSTMGLNCGRGGTGSARVVEVRAPNAKTATKDDLMAFFTNVPSIQKSLSQFS